MRQLWGFFVCTEHFCRHMHLTSRLDLDQIGKELTKRRNLSKFVEGHRGLLPLGASGIGMKWSADGKMEGLTVKQTHSSQWSERLLLSFPVSRSVSDSVAVCSLVGCVSRLSQLPVQSASVLFYLIWRVGLLIKIATCFQSVCLH